MMQSEINRLRDINSNAGKEIPVNSSAVNSYSSKKKMIIIERDITETACGLNDMSRSQVYGSAAGRDTISVSKNLKFKQLTSPYLQRFFIGKVLTWSCSSRFPTCTKIAVFFALNMAAVSIGILEFLTGGTKR